MTTEEARHEHPWHECSECRQRVSDALDARLRALLIKEGFTEHDADRLVAQAREIGSRFRPAAPSEEGNTLTIGATPEKYPLNKALSMDPSHVHLWTTGEEPDTFRCAECNTVGRLVMDSPRIRPAAQTGDES